MKNFERGTRRLLLLVLMLVIFTVSTLLPASAATYTVPVYSVNGDGVLTKIAFQIKYDEQGISDRHNVVIPETMNGKKIVKIAPNVLVGNNSVYTLTIPATVTNIEAAAFTGCNNLKKVTINNYEGGLKIADGAFPKSAEIVYLQEKPTAPPTTTQQPATTTPPPAPTAAKPPVATVAPSQKPTSSKKATKATKPDTSTVEESTTEEETVTITESTPFASAKAELSDINIWDQLVNPATEKVSDPITVKNPALNTASYAAVIVVSFSAIALGYFKFRR